MIGRIPISDVEPAVGCGRFPAKAVVGERFTVSATVFREGHDAVNANVALYGPDGKPGPMIAMTPLPPGDSPVPEGLGGGTDRWTAEVAAASEGLWSYAVQAWSDPIGTWQHNAEIKVPAGIDVDLMLEEGARLFERVAADAPEGAPRTQLADVAVALRDAGRPPEARMAPAFSREAKALLRSYPLREMVTESERFALQVDRRRALYGSWYEMFPRSEGAYQRPDGSWHSGTFREAMGRLPAIADMGFDVVYLPPIHPIGRVNRKGPNNTLSPGPHDPGSPWAIGSEEGGHDAVHPELGAIEDFDAFVSRTAELGMEVALDLALQCAPDHPWVREHPEWFTILTDGSIAYAENPPKKYQDIYPLNFDRDPEGIYAEVLRVVRYWMGHGVRIFRVDNPHTKPVNFWEWLLGEVRKTDPDVLFLAEAFTRPPMMHLLGKIGFHQSYTYFTWRTEKWEIEKYLRDLSGKSAAYMRPNFFVNTPDILHASLQYGGPAMFRIRAVLASTLSPSWGVYSGYELHEHVALRPGSEEYLDTEKFQYRPRDWASYEPGGPQQGESSAPYLRALNLVRRAHPALQQLRNLTFHDADDDFIMVYSKEEAEDLVLVCLNLDPHAARQTTAHLNMPALGLDWHDTFAVHDELTGATYRWGEHNYVRLDPYVQPAHIFTVRRNA